MDQRYDSCSARFQSCRGLNVSRRCAGGPRDSCRRALSPRVGFWSLLLQCAQPSVHDLVRLELHVDELIQPTLESSNQTQCRAFSTGFCVPVDASRGHADSAFKITICDLESSVSAVARTPFFHNGAGGAGRGRPAWRAALVRDKRCWASTRWGCPATGPDPVMKRLVNRAAVLVGARLAHAFVVQPFGCRALATILAGLKRRQPRLARAFDERGDRGKKGVLG